MLVEKERHVAMSPDCGVRQPARHHGMLGVMTRPKRNKPGWDWCLRTLHAKLQALAWVHGWALACGAE